MNEPTDAMTAYRDHVDALTARDLDAVVAGYAEDAVLVAGDRIVRGRDAVRGVFAGVLDAAAGLEPTVEVLVEGEVVFVSWTAEAGGRSLVGADTFVFADGLIAVHTGYVAPIGPGEAR